MCPWSGWSVALTPPTGISSVCGTQCFSGQFSHGIDSPILLHQTLRLKHNTLHWRCPKVGAKIILLSRNIKDDDVMGWSPSDSPEGIGAHFVTWLVTKHTVCTDFRTLQHWQFLLYAVNSFQVCFWLLLCWGIYSHKWLLKCVFCNISLGLRINHAFFFYLVDSLHSR